MIGGVGGRKEFVLGNFQLLVSNNDMFKPLTKAICIFRIKMEDDTGGEETSDYSSLSDELKNIQNHIKLTRKSIV